MIDRASGEPCGAVPRDKALFETVFGACAGALIASFRTVSCRFLAARRRRIERIGRIVCRSWAAYVQPAEYRRHGASRASGVV
ncbi:hypothetical protein [Paraburkholderia sp. SUR17]|uniref:hypothetical protein n=1 Tax=Paraburkholderia sp. SUR17 TaxID=3034358 RepID=UPI002407829B|nr:hypothetical protein [Paraburkholderia sp. SUR17]WEY38440.1 hypothetical protein P2869_15580 [Paraburkholderia sp. SUR17]